MTIEREYDIECSGGGVDNKPHRRIRGIVFVSGLIDLSVVAC